MTSLQGLMDDFFFVSIRSYVWVSMLLEVADDLFGRNAATEGLTHRVSCHHSNNQVWKSVEHFGEQTEESHL